MNLLTRRQTERTAYKSHEECKSRKAWLVGRDDICFKFKLESEKKNNVSMLSCTFSTQCVSAKGVDVLLGYCLANYWDIAERDKVRHLGIGDESRARAL